MTKLRSTSVAVLGVAAVMLLASCDWPMARGNPAGTGWNPDPSISSANAPSLTTSWSVTSSLPLHLVESQGTVVVGSIARNAADGALRWNAPDGLGSNGAAIVGDVVYGVVHPSTIPEDSDSIEAISRATGARLWSIPGDANFGVFPPIVAGGRLYAQGAFAHGPGSNISVYDLATRTRLFDLESGDFFGGFAVANGLLYVVDSSAGLHTPAPYALYAYDAANGTQRWAAPLAFCGTATTAPVVANGKVYTSGIAFDAKTGDFLWDWPACPVGPWSAVSSTRGVFLAATGGPANPDVMLEAFDANVGGQSWNAFISTNGTGTCAIPFISDNVVFASNGTTLGGYDLGTGVKRWTAPVAGLGDPIVADGTLYAAQPATQKLYAFRPTS